MKMNPLDWVVWLLLVVGGLNWGLVGLLNFDLINTITRGTVEYRDNIEPFGMVLYVLVGVAAIWSLVSMFTKGGGDSSSSQ